MKSEGNVKAHDLRLVKTGSPARQPVALGYTSDYDLKRPAGALSRGEILTGSSVTRLTGNYGTRGDSTVVHMKLTGQNLPIADVAGLLPPLGIELPAGSSLQGGTVTADLALDGALDRLVTTGMLDLANVKRAKFNLGSKMTRWRRCRHPHQLRHHYPGHELAPAHRAGGHPRRIAHRHRARTRHRHRRGHASNSNALDFKMAAKLNNNVILVGGLQRLAGLGQVNKPIPSVSRAPTQNPVFVPDVGGTIGNTVTAPARGVQGGIGGIMGIFQKKKQQ